MISALAVLWLGGLVYFPIGGLKGYQESGALPPLSLPMTAVSALLAYGLWSARPWGRILQLVILVPMMLLPPIGFAAMILFGYVKRPETRRYFVPSSSGRTWGAAEKWSQSEWPWILGVLAALGVGVLLLIMAAPLFRAWG